MLLILAVVLGSRQPNQGKQFIHCTHILCAKGIFEASFNRYIVYSLNLKTKTGNARANCYIQPWRYTMQILIILYPILILLNAYLTVKTLGL
jgi:hypothetical protein